MSILQMMLGSGGSPSIVTSGLVLYLDAGNSASYPGSGSTWFDLSGQNNNLTLTGSPTYSTANGGILQFNGTNQYGQNSLNLSSGTSTIIGAARYSGATRGRIITSVSNNWLLGHWSGTTENFYAEGWVTSVSAGANDTNWRILTGTNNVTGDLYSLYVNVSPSVVNSTAGAAGPNGISIGRWGNATEYSTCEVSFVLAYNRVLSIAEITQNYNVFRGRYGL